MKAQFDQNLLSSFYLWLENRLLKSDTKAYLTGLSNNFRYVDFDDIPADMVGYQGEYRQLVAEYNIDTVNSGFFIGDDFITGDSSANGNVYTDYNNGRILFPSASGTGLSVSGDYSVKEVNTYISHDSDLDFILQESFSIMNNHKFVVGFLPSIDLHKVCLEASKESAYYDDYVKRTYLNEIDAITTFHFQEEGPLSQFDLVLMDINSQKISGLYQYMIEGLIKENGVPYNGKDVPIDNLYRYKEIKWFLQGFNEELIISKQYQNITITLKEAY